ncbi:hypothetical protein [Microbulbifer sp. JMSA003]|uniref:hypothetical protein n=1 Tax=Microbulbifer sp. JMSA003 TaxID=3243369 RepID=UPI0040399778
MNGYESYLDISMLSKVVSEFSWPAPYKLEDDLPDRLIIVFPKCELYFSVDVDGESEVSFIWNTGGRENNIELIEALMIVVPGFERMKEPFSELNLINDRSLPVTPTVVKNNLRDTCTVLIEYFSKSIVGDFSWAARYSA